MEGWNHKLVEGFSSKRVWMGKKWQNLITGKMSKSPALTLYVIYTRRRRRKARRSAAGKCNPSPLKREMSNRWLAACPPRSASAARSRRKLNAAPLTEADTGETLLLGRDETDPELNGVAVYSDEWGDSGGVCRRWHKFKANVAPSAGEVTVAQSDQRGRAAHIPWHYSGFVGAVIDVKARCLELDDIISVTPDRLYQVNTQVLTTFIGGRALIDRG